MCGVFDQQSRVLSRLCQRPCLSPSALPGGGRLNAHLPGRGFQLPDKPIDTRCRPTFAWRRHRHRMQCPGTGTVTNMHPGRAHIIEIDRAGPRMFQVADEFRENPCLVGVADGPIRLLN